MPTSWALPLPCIGRVRACGRDRALRWLRRLAVRTLALYAPGRRTGLQLSGGHNNRALEDILDRADRGRPALSDSWRKRRPPHRFFAVTVSGGRLDLRRRRRVDLLPVCQARPVPRREFSHPVIAVHATYGTLPGELAKPRTEKQTLGVDPFFHLTNEQVHVSLTDTVAFEPPYVYPRSYDRTMWPTKGLCVSDVLPTTVSFSPLDGQTYAFPPDLPLSDSGLYIASGSERSRRMRERPPWRRGGSRRCPL